MSGVRRFLSRRERSPHHHPHLHKSKEQQHSQLSQPQQEPAKETPKQPDHFAGIFTNPNDSSKKPDKEEEKKVKSVLERLRHYGIDNITESNVEYALRTKPSQGDAEAAFRLLMLLEDTYEGIVKPYNPDMKLLGAVNRDAVTCYLDALLFAMFMRLDSFEAMLYENFSDSRRKRLAGLLRLWVNLLRSGRLITTDITAQIQRAIADCGWADAARLQQQDPSEAFTFITGQLELPMLTLKMDIHHTGKEDPQDDHKFVNERLLEVAILDQPAEGNTAVTLEDCLEHYFNNRIEIKRYLENQRRNTLTKLADSNGGPTKLEKEGASDMHIEVVEVAETPTGTPILGTPISETPTQSKMTPVERLRPSMSRKRADSIFSQRKFLDGIDPTSEAQQNEGENANPDGDARPDPNRMRKMSTRTEVLMPAWQFFKLLPWYTDNMPTSDAQVAAHFSKKRPVLGICLKRYSYTYSGQARRLNTYVDIPLEIAVPNFVSDEHMDEDGPLVGNFRLMLQSVVCHRGVSLNSGHYICLSRGRKQSLQNNSTTNSAEGERRGSTDSDDMEDPWLRFDDLAKERITPVDIHEALRKEMPYLLFYQVQPIGDDGHSIHDLPTYAEATSRSQSDAHVLPPEKPYLQQPNAESQQDLLRASSEPTAISPFSRPSTEATDFLTTSSSERPSLDVPRGRTPNDPDSLRRKSVTIDTDTTSTSESIRTERLSTSGPSTPAEEKKENGLLAVINSRRGSRATKLTEESRSRSRPSSRDNTNRFSLNMTKLTQMMSNRSDNAEAAASTPSAEKEKEVGTGTDAERAEKAAPAASVVPPPLTVDTSGPGPTNASKESVAAVKEREKASKHQRKEERKGKRKGGEKHEERDCVLM